jgi:hypothetical protein
MAQWEKHIDGDDHHIIKFRLKLYPDGTIRFIYRNILSVTADAAKKTGYPIIIGVQDGFATQKPAGQKGMLEKKIVFDFSGNSNNFILHS